MRWLVVVRFRFFNPTFAVAETTTASELRTLTQHLVSQPHARARLAELIHQLRMQRVPIAYPATLPGDVHPDELDPREPLIVHLKGRGHNAVLIAVGLEPPVSESDAEDFGTGLVLRPILPPEALVHELDRRGQPRSIYGAGALTTAAPQAIALRVIRDLHGLGEDLPGHVVLVFAPDVAVGGALFERAGEQVRELLRKHRLRPTLALVPGRPQPGIVERAGNRVVLATGTLGLMTVQLLVTGQPAAPSSRFRALDPAALINALTRDLVGQANQGKEGRILPPPVISDLQLGAPAAPGWPAPWGAARLSMAVAETEPAKFVESLTDTLFKSFQREIGEQNQRYARLRPRTRTPADGLGKHLPWQPLAVDYAKLRRTCRYELPPFQPPPKEMNAKQALYYTQQQALQRMRFVYQHSPYAGTPTVLVGLVPPLLPPAAMDPEETQAFEAIKQTSKEYDVLRTSNGLLGDAWHRLAHGLWGAKASRSVHEQSPLGETVPGFGLRTEWGHWPLIGFGPVGRGAGSPSECVDVEPSFTRLPELIRTLIVRVLAGDFRPNLVESTWVKLRRFTERLGIVRRHDARDDDDDVLYAGIGDHEPTSATTSTTTTSADTDNTASAANKEPAKPEPPPRPFPFVAPPEF